MQSRSFGSVKIFWLNRERICEELRSAALDLAQRCPEVDEVWLFGSLARGDAVPGSDADVLVVLSEARDAFEDRAPRYALAGCRIGVDLLAYTRSELDSMRGRSPRFYRTFMAERKPLYLRPPSAAEPDG